jgi:hypothetical protein
MQEIRGEVMNWARLWLVQHKAITNFNESEEMDEDMLRGIVLINSNILFTFNS